jgi:hypothetical protein
MYEFPYYWGIFDAELLDEHEDDMEWDCSIYFGPSEPIEEDGMDVYEVITQKEVA